MEKSTQFTTDFIIQYSIVGLILLTACIWIAWKIFKKKKNKSSACCGCAISESCVKKDIKIKSNKHGNNQNL